MSGTLYLCGTPIGNLEDITLRTLEVLKSADVIAAEDTRHTLGLLNHYEIKTPLISYHEHNKLSKGPYLLERLLNGESIALVTDAGMPGISDPGEDLVKLCIKNNVKVTSAPGATAAVTALVLSGFSARRFIFEGFLPMEKKERRQVLSALEKESRTTVFYEAPHRLAATLEDLYKAAGDRKAAAVRELTKIYEEVRRGSLSELLAYYKENAPRGEFVLIVEGISEEKLRQEEIEAYEKMTLQEHMDFYFVKGLSKKDAMKQVAKDRGVSKREIYAALLENEEE